MSLSGGTRLGPYEIVGMLGSGGMGEVYRAHDPRLGRDVAIKVLPEAFSVDPERLRRFEQEARAAAALNHPNLLAVYDVGTTERAPYIVSELLEGDTLRTRLASGVGVPPSDQEERRNVAGSPQPVAGLPVRKAVDCALQVAQGLAAAHEKGIVHRDLKPENVFITHEGRVKILDFGLAKLTEPIATGTNSAMVTEELHTSPGMVLGTIGYMAPEQVRGQPADQRSDLFALGAILYEMLAGHRAFQGPTPADTLSAILQRDPADLPMAERRISPALALIVDRCLQKSQGARFQSASDLAFALEALSTHVDSITGASTVSAVPTRRLPRANVWSIVAGFAAVIAILAGLWYRRGFSPEPAPVSIRFTIAPPADATFGTGGTSPALAVSPDGKRIVFTASRRDRNQPLLWIRALDSLEARVLPGTEGVIPASSVVFWSLDSRFIAFYTDGKLKKIDVTGGPAQTLCESPGPFRGGTWNRDGTILFTSSGSIFRVSASGGQPVPATKKAPGETAHGFPFFLPDSRHFLYAAQPGLTIYVASLDSPDTRKLTSADSKAEYAAGHLLFVRQGTLLAQPFDPGALKLSGEAVPVAEQIRYNTGNGAGVFDVSSAGVLAYRAGNGGANSSHLTWFDRTGKKLGTVGNTADYRGVELAPDGRHVAFHPHDSLTGGDLWLFDLTRGTSTRFTYGGHNSTPIWSPDGTRIVFASNHPLSGSGPNGAYDGTFDIFEKRSDNTGETIRLLDSAGSKLTSGWKQPVSWSPDGNTILFEVADPKTNYDLYALPLTRDRRPTILLQTVFNEFEAQISPDGRWFAYTSEESGRRQVYVQSLSGAPGKLQVSTEGGSFARWRRDGKELYYISADRKLMAVDVSGKGAAFQMGIPRALFEVRGLPGTFFLNVSGSSGNGGAKAPIPYDVSADGQRFLLTVTEGSPAAEDPLTVDSNWARTLAKQ